MISGYLPSACKFFSEIYNQIRNFCFNWKV
jgi:hypothetical protein